MSSKTDEDETTVAIAEPCTIEDVNEKSAIDKKTPEKLNEHHEAAQPDKIFKASRQDPNVQQPPPSYGQTPVYYERQRVAGRPVYVQVYIFLKKAIKVKL